jgi:general secretion pathway protein B
VSYLLETLKRVEQRRSREGTSDLLLVQGEVTRERKKRAAWPYLLSLALLANAAVALWWVSPWRADRSSSSRTYLTERETERQSQPSVAPTPRKGGVDVPSVSQAKRHTERQASTARPAAPDLEKNADREASVAEPQVIRRPEPTRRSQTSPASQTTEKKPTLTGKVFDLQDLPAAVRAGVPQMKISVHSYEADRNSRLVRINDKTLREGESFTPEIRVEEITQGGMILSLQGYLFRVFLDHIRRE